MLDEQTWAVFLVPVARAGEFFGMLYFSEVVNSRPETNGVSIYIKLGKVGGETVKKLDSSGVDEDKMPDE